MKSKQAKKQTKQSHETLYPFRVVVRGTVGAGKKAKRVRKVFTEKAPNEGVAAERAQARIDKECKALSNLYMNVFAPLESGRKSA
jgi:hypothetical protein